MQHYAGNRRRAFPGPFGECKALGRDDKLYASIRSQHALAPEPLERLDEVAQFGLPEALIRDLLVQAEAPGEVTPCRFPMKVVDLARIGLDVLLSSGKPRLDQAVRLAAHGPCYLIKADLGVILHAPEHAAVEADLGGLDGGDTVPRQQHGAGRKHLNLVRVDGWRVVRGRPAGQERVGAPGLGRGDAPGEGGLEAAPVGPHSAPCRHRGDLQAGAGSECRGA